MDVDPKLKCVKLSFLPSATIQINLYNYIPLKETKLDVILKNGE